jgi:hypothetical protein
MIHRDTPWRAIGAVPYETWARVISTAGGPVGLASREAWQAAGEHSALALAMLKQESSYGTDFDANPASNHNPLNLKIPTGGGYVQYPTWAAGINGWRERLTNPLYKNGIYQDTRTIADLIYIYAPPFDQTKTTTEAYITTLLGLLNAWKPDVTIPDGEGEETPMPDEMITFGRVPMYGYTDRQHVTANKPEGVGWDNLGKRQPKFIALHRMLGSLQGTDGYFADPTVQALTDFGVGVEAMDGKALAGHIYQWNDPLGHRSGWASGRVSAPYGDGKRIVDKYGVIAVNRDGVSVEISGRETMPIDDFAWGEIVHLCAWWADFMRIPYNTRTNPATGINYLIWHQEFTIGTGKECPFEVVMAQTNRLYNDIAAFLKPYQTGVTGEPEPQPEPEPIPDPAYAPPLPVRELVEYSDYEADSMKAVIAVDGHDYVFVNDRVRATKRTPRLQTANRGARRVGPDISKGYEFNVVWLFTAKDGRRYYLTENWTRCLQEDTERIKDAA